MCLGIPGEVVGLSEHDGLPFATVRFGGITREVCLSVQPDVALGDFVLVHVGLAISKIDRVEAERAWAILQDIGQTAEVEPPDETEPIPAIRRAELGGSS
jgi:hydrogenase expression/formation protein HypC